MNEHIHVAICNIQLSHLMFVGAEVMIVSVTDKVHL